MRKVRQLAGLFMLASVTVLFVAQAEPVFRVDAEAFEEAFVLKTERGVTPLAVKHIARVGSATAAIFDANGLSYVAR